MYLFKYGNDKLLARTAVLEILLNQEINDNTHNRRLTIDVWSGKKYIIPHDFSYNRTKIDKENFNLDICSSGMKLKSSNHLHIRSSDIDIIFPNISSGSSSIAT